MTTLFMTEHEEGLERALSHFALFNPFSVCDEIKYVLNQEGLAEQKVTFSLLHVSVAYVVIYL